MKNKRILIIVALTLFVAVIYFALISNSDNPEKPKTETTAQTTAAADERYETIQKTPEDIHKGQLILVNNTNRYRFTEEQNLISVYDNMNKSQYFVKNTTLPVSETMMTPLNTMLGDFYKQTNSKSVNIISGYRSTEQQQELLNAKIEEVGEAEAAKWVATPGASEHHTGLAVDFSIFNSDGSSTPYDGSGIYAWINENCHKYGFIVRYDESKSALTGISFEPWHFRYLGNPHATLAVQNNLCYEEYIGYLKNYTLESPLKAEVENKSYEIYYTNTTEIKIPKNAPHQISGNNVDGFIITIEK